MTSLRLRGETYHAIFRIDKRQYERSLKTANRADADFVVHVIEQSLHRLRTGQQAVPPGVDPGDFVISGGQATRRSARDRLPSLKEAIGVYLAYQEHRISDSYRRLQKTHLSHFCRFLGRAADSPCDRVAPDRPRIIFNKGYGSEIR
jgi:hypothetical protein